MCTAAPISAADAEAFEKVAKLPDDARLRRVRVVRDYGMFDRRESPQYYPAIGAEAPPVAPRDPNRRH